MPKSERYLSNRAVKAAEDAFGPVKIRKRKLGATGAERIAANRARKKAAGVCTGAGCHEPARPERTKCQRCNDLGASYVRSGSARRRAGGPVEIQLNGQMREQALAELERIIQLAFDVPT
jgi:hypothetical protein